MSYKIMTKVESKADNNSTYKYLKITDAEGNINIFEAETIAELKTQVESMLNDGDYAKSDFICIMPVDYEIDTDLEEGG